MGPHQILRRVYYCFKQISHTRMLHDTVSSVHDSSTMALWKAAHQQDTEGVALALRNGADVNAWDENGDTPLHLAAFANNTDMISVLTEAPKVNIDKGDEFGRTPLYIAVDVRAKQVLILTDRRLYFSHCFNRR